MKNVRAAKCCKKIQNDCFQEHPGTADREGDLGQEEKEEIKPVLEKEEKRRSSREVFPVPISQISSRRIKDVK